MYEIVTGTLPVFQPSFLMKGSFFAILIMAGLIAAVKCGVCWKTSYNWTTNKLLRMQKRSKTHITSPVVPRGTDGVELSISDNSFVFLFPLLSDLVPWEALLGLCFEVICGNLFRALSVSRACSSSHRFFRPFIVIWTRRSEEWKVFIRIASGVRHRFYLLFLLGPNICGHPTCILWKSRLRLLCQQQTGFPRGVQRSGASLPLIPQGETLPVTLFVWGVLLHRSLLTWPSLLGPFASAVSTGVCYTSLSA